MESLTFAGEVFILVSIFEDEVMTGLVGFV